MKRRAAGKKVDSTSLAACPDGLTYWRMHPCPTHCADQYTRDGAKHRSDRP